MPLAFLSLQEVEYSEEPGKLYYFRYPIAGGGPDDFLPVATTRPETVLGDTAVAVHPEDERYKRFVGRNAVVPMSGGREIPVIADEVGPFWMLGSDNTKVIWWFRG